MRTESYYKVPIIIVTFFLSGCTLDVKCQSNNELEKSFTRINNLPLLKERPNKVVVERLDDGKLIKKSKDIQKSGGLLIGTTSSFGGYKKDPVFKKITANKGGDIALVGDHPAGEKTYHILWFKIKKELHSYVVAILKK
jgi:hypothetical protein